MLIVIFGDPGERREGRGCRALVPSLGEKSSYCQLVTNDDSKATCDRNTLVGARTETQGCWWRATSIFVSFFVSKPHSSLPPARSPSWRLEVNEEGTKTRGPKKESIRHLKAGTRCEITKKDELVAGTKIGCTRGGGMLALRIKQWLQQRHVCPSPPL